MDSPLLDQLLRCSGEAAELYHRLVLLVGLPPIRMTATLKEMARSTSYPLINVNLELSRHLLELTERQRTLQIPALLDKLVSTSGSDTIILDRIEILFDVRLKQNPLRCLQGLARNRTVVTAWPGAVVGKPGSAALTYATPGHPEYRRDDAGQVLIVDAACSHSPPT